MVMMNRFNFRQQHHEIIICASLSSGAHLFTLLSTSPVTLAYDRGLTKINTGDIKIMVLQGGGT